jgi:hypothetical protein
LKGFEARVKSIDGLQPQNITDHKSEVQVSYTLAKHFKALGPKSKLLKSVISSEMLTFVSCFYNINARFNEACLYAQAAISSSDNTHTAFGLATSQLLISKANLDFDLPDLNEYYSKGLQAVEWHWGTESPLLMTLHDVMSLISHKKDPQTAFEYHMKSLKVCEKAFGKSHVITGGYLTRVIFMLTRRDAIRQISGF